jgi:broad specificity phosphatase PhoE
MQSPTRLFLIRHGEVEPRYHRVFGGGQIDMELSPIGHEQAAALARYLERFPFDAIYSSPMRRVQQTLSQIVELQNKLAMIMNDLREVDFGAWTGLSWEQVHQQFQISAFQWLDQLEEGLIENAETMSAFQQRVEKGLRTILEDCPEKTVAVVCHGGVIRMLLSILLDIPIRKTACFDVEYASVTIVDYLPPRAEVELLNFTPWRDLA